MLGPRVVRLLVEALLPRTESEFIVGDMEELYVQRAASSGRRRAMLMYVRDALLSVVSRRLPRPPSRLPQSPEHRSRSMATAILADLRAAVRTLRRETGFTAIAVFTLALGMGSTAAVFGMINQLVLRPLPGVTTSEDVGYLRFHDQTEGEWLQAHGLTTNDFDVLRTESTAFAGVASYGLSILTIRVPDRRPISVRSQIIYGDFFEVLGVRASEGRMLRATETDLLANPLVAVISQELRNSLYSASEEVVGRTLVMNNHPVTIVGVAGGGFRGPERGNDNDVWLPYGALVPLIGFDLERLRSPRSTMHDDILVRLQPGVSVDAAEAQVAGMLDRFAENRIESAEYMNSLQPVIYPRLAVPPMWRVHTATTLRVLAGVVALVLLIACANVANLLLVRNVKRRGFLAMHRALGASTGRIARRHVLESLLLSVLGSLAGLVVAWLIGIRFRGEELLQMPTFEGLRLDWRVVVFAASASIITAMLFGAVPALLAGRFHLGAALKATGQRETGRFASLRSVISAGQIAMSLALLVGAALLTSTVRNLYNVDSGVDIENVFELSIDKPDALEGAGLDAWHRDVIATLEAMPGVERVALDMYGPHGASMSGRIRLPGTPREESLSATMYPVTPGWFEIFRVRPVSGRIFEPRDWSGGTAPGILVTASLARRLLGTDQVVGRRVLAGFGQEEDLEIVGVIGDIRPAFTPGEPQDAMFMTYDAAPPLGFMTVLIRTTKPDAALSNAIRAAVENILPDKAVPDPEPMSNRVDAIHSERRIFSRLLGLLSALAVLLAAVGLYGTISFDVTGRRREFGIRLALGAQRRSVGELVLRYAALIVIAGTIFGMAGGFALSRVLENRLFGIAPTDVEPYLFGAVLFSLVALCACITPVLAAVRVNPMVTLKHE